MAPPEVDPWLLWRNPNLFDPGNLPLPPLVGVGGHSQTDSPPWRQCGRYLTEYAIGLELVRTFLEAPNAPLYVFTVIWKSRYILKSLTLRELGGR
jgi:hypothetical protein